MTSKLLLEALPSKPSCLRQRIPGVTPGLSFLGNPTDPLAYGWRLLRHRPRRRARGGYFVPGARFPWL